MQESTVRGSEAVLQTYKSYIDRGEFTEEMFFYKSLESTTTASSNFNKLKKYLNINNIPVASITYCATNSVPVVMEKKNKCFLLIRIQKCFFCIVLFHR